jgi:predicted alpha/beta-hydrolase family hydrolase
LLLMQPHGNQDSLQSERAVSLIGCSAFLDAQAGEPTVRGFLHLSTTPSSDVLVLTHGAGGNCQSALLVSLAERFASSGLNVLRIDLPFRQLRPKGPPSPSGAMRDQQGLGRAVTVMRQRFQGRVFLGGQSYGGRQASLLASSDAALADALLLLSYPLHPPGRPAQMRTAHFPAVRAPSLFVHGLKDPFASSEELAGAVTLIPAHTKVLEVADAGHSLLTRHNADHLCDGIVREFAAILAAPPTAVRGG